MIITLSGNSNNRGLIFNVNNEIKRILDFDKKEVIGVNITAA